MSVSFFLLRRMNVCSHGDSPSQCNEDTQCHPGEGSPDQDGRLRFVHVDFVLNGEHHRRDPGGHCAEQDHFAAMQRGDLRHARMLARRRVWATARGSCHQTEESTRRDNSLPTAMGMAAASGGCDQLREIDCLFMRALRCNISSWCCCALSSNGDLEHGALPWLTARTFTLGSAVTLRNFRRHLF
jgi:hypothetical protein